jgi:hypothetical protein
MWGLAGVRCLRPERAYSRLLGIRRPWLLAYVCVDCVRSFIFMSAVDLHIWRQMTWSGPKNTVSVRRRYFFESIKEEACVR